MVRWTSMKIYLTSLSYHYDLDFTIEIFILIAFKSIYTNHWEDPPLNEREAPHYNSFNI